MTGEATANRWNRRWSIKVLGISRLSDVVALCRRLEAIAGVRLVRVNGISADYIRLALVTVPSIDKAAMETLWASLPGSMLDEASFEIEESDRPGSRYTVRR